MGRFTVLMAIVTTLVGLSGAFAATPYAPPPRSSGDWRTLLSGSGVTPTTTQKARIKTTAGLDWNKLKLAWDYSKNTDAGSNLLVIRYGWIAGEWGNTVTPRSVFSVSKSLTAMAFNRLFDKSAAGQLAQAIHLESFAYQYLPASWGTEDARRKLIKIKHLLTMCSGLTPVDGAFEGNYFAFMMNPTVQAAPEKIWVYSSMAVDLLGVILQNVTGQRLDQFLATEIHPTIGIESARWGVSPAGFTRAAGGGKYSARELARMGYLLLNDGLWGTQRVLSASYVDDMTNWATHLDDVVFRTTPNSPFVVPPDAPDYYGWLWWTNLTRAGLGASVPRNAFYAHGLGSKLMVVIPSLDMVVVRLGSGPQGSGDVRFKRRLMRRIRAAVVTPTPTPSQ